MPRAAMRLAMTETHVDFLAGDRLAGRYVHGDAYKPHLHPLNTPSGHTLSLLSPHDHKHHKGLMYALRTRQVNFWEEYATTEDEKVGRQRHDGFLETDDEGDTVGFRQRLTWLAVDGGLPTFEETRTLRCRIGEHDAAEAYAWTWRCELRALRHVELVMSRFSVEDSRGRPVNYHGLGLRLRRDFGCTGGNRLRLDREEASFGDGLGAAPASASFEGSIDTTWPVAGGGARIEQSADHALFVLDAPFAFMSFGPSNAGPVELAEGATLDESYEVVVYDCAPPPRRTASRAGTVQ